MNQDSPFETWRLANLKQVAVSSEIRELLARAYEGGFIDGMQKQAQSSVDKAVNAMSQRQWRGLTDKEFEVIIMSAPNATVPVMLWQLIQDKLKEKNS